MKGLNRWSVNLALVALGMSIVTVSCHLLGTSDGQYYVSPDGWDFARGTEAHPWQTLETAAGRAEPGDTIHILPGTYREQLQVQNSGEPGNPVTFVGHDGAILDGTDLQLPDDSGMRPALIVVDGKAHVVISGLETANSQMGVYIIAASDVELRDLTVSGTSSHGIYVSQSTDIVVDGNSLIDVAKDGPAAAIQVEETEGFEVADNVISDVGLIGGNSGGGYYGSAGIVSGLGSSGGSISGNTIDDVSDEGIMLVSWSGLNIQDITIADNAISACTTGIKIFFTAFDEETPVFENIAVVGNSVSGTAEEAILVNTNGNVNRAVHGVEISRNRLIDHTVGISFIINPPEGTGPRWVDDVEIANNLVVGSSEIGIFLAPGWYGAELPTLTDARIVNNTVVDSGADGLGGCSEIGYSGTPDPGAGGPEITIANNIFTGGESYSLVVRFSNAEVDHNLFTEGFGVYQETHGVSPIEVVDPLFVDPATGDYALSAGSPARDAGNDSLAPAVDILGTQRPQGASVDIGAFEYVP